MTDSLFVLDNMLLMNILMKTIQSCADVYSTLSLLYLMAVATFHTHRH